MVFVPCNHEYYDAVVFATEDVPAPAITPGEMGPLAGQQGSGRLLVSRIDQSNRPAHEAAVATVKVRHID